MRGGRSPSPKWRSGCFGCTWTTSPGEVLDGIVADAFAAFDHPQVVPLVDFREYQMLELFHGPTLSFKDVALQVLGRLFEHILRVRQGRLNIMGATSGDTGSAAIHGVRGRADINIFVLFPKGRVSALQERQMTTVPDANVHCLAIEGSFDDCQAILKSAFGDAAFKQDYALGAVNSMNWARVLAQMSYYIHAALHDDGAGDGAVFSVPTGNFGNIFAGIAVRAMGVPIRRFMLATNDNDILARFFQSGVYKRGQVRHTISPSMDIQVASNFERFLHLRFGGDAERVRKFMADFAANGEATVDDGKPIDEGIASAAIGTEETLATMRDVFAKHRCVVDPHTAVSIAAARRLAGMGDSAKPICMAAGASGQVPGGRARGVGRWRTRTAPDAGRAEGCADAPHDAAGEPRGGDGLRAPARLRLAWGGRPRLGGPRQRRFSSADQPCSAATAAGKSARLVIVASAATEPSSSPELAGTAPELAGRFTQIVAMPASLAARMSCSKWSPTCTASAGATWACAKARSNMAVSGLLARTSAAQ